MLFCKGHMYQSPVFKNSLSTACQSQQQLTVFIQDNKLKLYIIIYLQPQGMTKNSNKCFSLF